MISSSGTTGLRTWEAALHLAAYLTSNSGLDLVRNKKVLELGAGTGFLSILSAVCLEAAAVTVTDGDEGVFQALEDNIFLNGLEGDSRVTPGILRWGQTLMGSMFDEDMQEKPYDLIIGADIVGLIFPCFIFMSSQLQQVRNSEGSFEIFGSEAAPLGRAHMRRCTQTACKLHPWKQIELLTN